MEEKIREITIEDREYPQLLKKIADPPKKLFIRGRLDPQEQCFAIVGTRRCSEYGWQMAQEIASDLAQAGLTIVSGFAKGIDTAAHQGAVKAGKRTIAVLGTGLDEKSIYPQTNLNLGKKILAKGGALISEYPPGTLGARFTFPQRNRIISGLSLGVLVIEGKRRSGSLITANWAKEQGRKIFALPGQVLSLNSKAPHLLIKQGAKLVESANDILEELNLPLKAKEKEKTSLGKTREEKLILKALSRESLSIDKIIEKTGLEVPVVLSCLTLLETRGKIKNLGSNTFTIVS